MATETTPNGATATAVADRSTDLVNRLLKLPEQVRLDLANLLLDSVREGFTSLEEAENRDKELIRSRIEQLVSGKVEPVDLEDMFAEMRRRVAEVQLLRSRIEAYERGEIKATDWREALDRVERQFRQESSRVGRG